MNEKVKLLLASSRPVSWINTAYPFAAAYIVLGGALDLMFWIGTLFFLIPYNLLMYGVNDVFDYESDIKNPRKGGVEGAVTPKHHHRLILISSFISCLPFVVWLAILGNPTSFAVLLGVLFFVVAYSLKGLRFKEKPILDAVTSSLHFVGPFIYALSLFAFPVEAWPYVIAFFFWGMASQAFGAVQDIIPDKKAGIQSVATVFGAQRTVLFSAVLYILAAIVVLGTGLQNIAIAACALVYAVNVIPFARVSNKTSGVTRLGWKRFLWINYFVGFVITLQLIISTVL
ncbi:prenyltransferase [Candidatus Saccharibacteria bacterium]|nr:prenyltransferase [Candidatus Saccharibacteria bacterium]